MRATIALAITFFALFLATSMSETPTILAPAVNNLLFVMTFLALIAAALASDIHRIVKGK